MEERRTVIQGGTGLSPYASLRSSSPLLSDPGGVVNNTGAREALVVSLNLASGAISP
jgi:hypothetical protein